MTDLSGQRIYLLPIGGTGMASLAGLLQAAGAEVSGSDGPLYPPMSILLEKLGIVPLVGFDPAHLVERPIDLVVIGNAVPRTNPEVVAVLESGRPYTSMPAAVRELLLPGRHSVVVTGTHGKTTTSALIAWVLQSAARAPSFLVGGELRNFSQNFQLGKGDFFVIEGDEYNTAFFDRGAKFLHYAARTLLVNNVELDHVDIYPDFEAVLAAFRAAVARVPGDGVVVWNFDDPGAARAVTGPSAASRVSFSGSGQSEADWRATLVGEREFGLDVRFVGPDRVIEAGLPWDGLAGQHNLANALGATAVLANLGLSSDEIANGLESFRGVRRRLEVVAEADGVTVVDDFAHHPTAVRETIAAARKRFAGRPIVAIFEPRSLSAARNLFQDDYRDALSTADRVFLVPPHHAGRVQEGERLDVDRLVREIRGPEVVVESDLDRLVERIAGGARAGDVLLCMSSGAFGGLPGRLGKRLAAA